MNAADELSENQDLTVLKNHTARLMEDFDTVQIFCTHHRGNQGGTVRAAYGGGNWYARYGQVACWLKMQDEETCREVR